MSAEASTISDDDKNQIILARLANGDILTQEDGAFLFACPHCSLAILVSPQDIACQQFVHGVMKDSGQGVNPHASQEECTRLLQQNAIHGCGQAYFFDGKEVRARSHG